MTRTRWFNCVTEPPVMPGPYERDCTAPNWVGETGSKMLWDRDWQSRYSEPSLICPHCRWRGLTKPAGSKP